MARYDRHILNCLLDSYEKSRLFTGENRVAVSISFPFSKKSMPAYFEESSLAYEEIHACMKELERQGFLTVVWKSGRVNHIISKVILNTEKLDEIYAFLRRIPRLDLLERNKEMLQRLEQEWNTPVAGKLIGYLRERMEENKSVKEYIDLADMEKTECMIRAVGLIERNESPCYIREFSIRHFADSKTLDGMTGILTRVMHDFGGTYGRCGENREYKDKELKDILAEYRIYHTPDYVYFKGEVTLEIKGKMLNIGPLRQGVGLSGEDLPQIRLADAEEIKKIITIENLTTFFRWQEKNSLILYLGGYHNSVRRSLLKMIYEELPSAQYYHFGDIDVGGFEIYEDLCAKTQIPFQLYQMDLDTLQKYENYGKTLTENDKKRIRKILESRKPVYAPVLAYMLAHNVKLEQECIIRE